MNESNKPIAKDRRNYSPYSDPFISLRKTGPNLKRTETLTRHLIDGGYMAFYSPRCPAIVGIIFGLMVISWISLSDFFPNIHLPQLNKNLAIVPRTMAIVSMGFFAGFLMSTKSTRP
jgi:hypothetical protein